MGISTANLKKVHNVRVVNEVLFGAKVRTLAWKRVSQIALRNFQRGRVKVSIYVILLKGKYGK